MSLDFECSDLEFRTEREPAILGSARVYLV